MVRSEIKEFKELKKFKKKEKNRYVFVDLRYIVV